jgi:MYXO-CTERM domain-containing protein
MKTRAFPRHLAIALGLAALTHGEEASANGYVDDPLTLDAHPGRGSQGGSFGPEGWTTTSGTDAIWYEIPDALPTGSLSFRVKGISPQTTLTGADHDILAIYQAPSGQAEPIAYSPYFRNNDFKMFTRIFGVQEPDRAGAMKLEFAFCPRGEPWHHDEPCAPECGKNDLAYANGMDKDIGWDPQVSYQIGLSWGSGVVTFSRDGAALGSIAYQGSYAPKPLRVRLGSPRHGISDVAQMPVGITFKDMVVAGDPGPMTPVCDAPPPPPDGGMPDASDDAGTSSSGGGGSSSSGGGGSVATGGGGSASGGTGGSGGAGSGGKGGSDGSSATSGGGCGCQAAGGSASLPALLALVLLAGRRRARR